MPSSRSSRRAFLQQSFAYSALAGLGLRPVFASAQAGNSNGIELLAVGDWGWTDPAQGQSTVATAMRTYAAGMKQKPEALLLLGDSWYGPLEGGAQSPRWKTQFEEMYPVAAFPGPAYTVLGNHDYQNAPTSKVDAELEYARTGTEAGRKTRWTLPARWYAFELPAQNPLVKVVALDSNVPAHHGAGSGFFTMTDQMRQEQLAWLTAELARPRKAPFLLVMGHHPLYSNGKHGDNDVLIQDWDPLFRQHKVAAYLAGHDHDLQHLEFRGHPTSFFCSGAGGADLYNIRKGGADRAPFAEKVYGFSHISVSPSLLTFRHLDSAGHLLHAFTKSMEGDVHLLEPQTQTRGL